jgi:hypothetical protein
LNRHDFDLLAQKHIQNVLDLNRTKGADYATDDDVLVNFKRGGERLGLTSLQVWGTYAGKHIDAIFAFVRNNGKLESEPIGSRIDDLMVYLLLLAGLIDEHGELNA